MVYEIYRIPECDIDALELADIMRADAVTSKKKQKENESNRKKYEQEQQRRIGPRNYGHSMRHYGHAGKRNCYRAGNR